MAERIRAGFEGREAREGRVTAGVLGPRDRDDIDAYLRRQPREDLFLLDLAAQLGAPVALGEPRVELLGAWRAGELVGVAAVRPSLVVATGSEPAALEAWVPLLARLDSGLVKSAANVVDPLWRALERQGLRALVDRTETAYALTPDAVRASSVPEGVVVRPAVEADLPALVTAARASLREEGRPDPAFDDPEGFRRWVRARVARARVVEWDGDVVFAGYADVQRPEGWLVQGVYTWPGRRRQGVAVAGVAALCAEAFEHGAEHVQLAVVDGNRAGEALYARLGFTAFAQLRTILFA